MRPFVFLAGFGLAGMAQAQAVVSSAAPERVAVTVYRDPDRGTEPMNLGWLGGYALVSETRRVSIPEGETELRFEGVTSGIVPQSAIVTGLGEAVLEKNRDARLLSPGALLDASLGERLHLRRTSRATGTVREQDAVVRATNDGVVIQGADGIEALRCTGLSETLVADRVPVGLSAKPTLSVRIRSPRPVERTVTLSYITNNFDWQADYVADLSDQGDSISLFGWMTLANGDQTGLADAQTQAIAGKLNRQRVWVSPGEAKPLRISCWPQGTTSDIPEEDAFERGEDIMVSGSRRMPVAFAPPAPPPPPAAPERDSYRAQEERLGDVRLYRVPVTVTVAAKSQKQIALLRQPAVKVENIVRLRPTVGPINVPLERVFVSYNRRESGLGLALPAGKVALFARKNGHRILIGEGQIDDYAVGERVEISAGTTPGVRANAVSDGASRTGPFVLTIANDLSTSQIAEVELPPVIRTVGARIVKRDGLRIWRVVVPANGTARLRYAVAE